MSSLRRKKENQSTDETMRKQETEKGRNDGKRLSHVRKANTAPGGWAERSLSSYITHKLFSTHMVLFFTNPL